MYIIFVDTCHNISGESNAVISTILTIVANMKYLIHLVHKKFLKFYLVFYNNYCGKKKIIIKKRTVMVIEI